MTTDESSLFPQDDRTDRQRLILSGLLLLGAFIALYAALIVFSRIDWMIAPSKQFRFGDAPVISIGKFEIRVPIDPPLIDPGSDYSPKDRINLLVMGLDRRPEEGHACTRADTFFVVSFDSFNHTASVLSFPRDMYVDLPDGSGGSYAQRINTTTVFGCGDRYPGGGPGLARDTLMLNFGIRVDHHLIIDFVGFQRLIDSLGGIDINVPEAIAVNSKQFAAGPQHMDGERALTYSRLRPDGDFKRIERQQLVMTTVASKALGLGLLNDPVGTYQQYQDTVETDVPTGQLPGLGLLAKDVGLDKVETYSMACYRAVKGAPCTPALTSFTTSEGAAVQRPVWPLSFAIINQAMPDPGILGDAATVGILGPDDETVAAVRDYLIQRGIAAQRISVTGLTADDGSSRKIYDVNEKDYTAQRIGEWLGIDGDVLRVQEGEASGANVVIVLGDDYRLPDGAVVRK